jgi:putative nucleotidyltransferase with HDIG domain
MWDGADTCKTWIKNNMVVDVTGTMATYNDAPQFIISTMVKCTIFDTSLLTPSLELQKIDEIMSRLDEFRLKITNETCKTVWQAVIGTPVKKQFVDGIEIPSDSFREQFSKCPGGKGEVHHAYCGGLAQHSESMVTIAENVADKFGLDKDILMTGCLIHDLGKIESYQWTPVIDLTDEGRLLHHTTLGYKMLLDMTYSGLHRVTPDTTFLKLAHIIISHHDEEGIRKPMFPEAVAVALIDSMDAATIHARDFSRKPENKEADSNWTKFCQLTGRQYFCPETIRQY